MSVLTKISAITLSFLVSGLVYPYKIPLITPLMVLTFLVFFLQLLLDKNSIIINKELCLFYFLIAFFFLWGGLLTGKIYRLFLQDLINCLIMILFIPVLSAIYKRKRYVQFKEIFIKANVILLFPLSLLCLYKFYQLINGVKIERFVDEASGIYRWGTSLQYDYNMTALGLMVGFFSALYLFFHKKSFIQKTIFLSVSLVILVAALLTGSRRMYVAFALIILGFFVVLSIKVVKITKRIFIKQKFSRSQIIGGFCMLFFMLFLIMGIGRTVKTYTLNRETLHQVEIIIERLDTLATFGETLVSSRGGHTERAIELINSFSLPNVFLGNGFNYLEQFASVQDQDEDYPHNPIISAMLYGGVISAIVLILFFARASWLYIRHIDQEKYFFILFIISVLFSIISSNSIFSNRFFLVLLIFPFLFRNMHDV
jgi:hypothetical protein